MIDSETKQVERSNKTIEDILSMLITENHMTWDTQLPFVMMAYNSSPQNPPISNRLMFGREVDTPIILLIKSPKECDHLMDSEYNALLRESMLSVYEIL